MVGYRMGRKLKKGKWSIIQELVLRPEITIFWVGSSTMAEANCSHELWQVANGKWQMAAASLLNFVR